MPVAALSAFLWPPSTGAGKQVTQNTWAAYHGHVDIAGIQFHVDLLVDGGLTVLMVVLADLAGHLDVAWQAAGCVKAELRW